MIFYIYKITNLINDKYYLGKRSFKGDSINDDKYFGSGTLLKKALKKYGKDNFKKEIVTICLSFEELNKVERDIINENIINDKNSYNLALGGWGGNLGDIVNNKIKMICQSEEYRKKMSDIINSPEIKDRMISSIKKTMSDISWKEKFSKIQKDVQNKEENKIRNSKNQKFAQNKYDVVKKKSDKMNELYLDENFRNKHLDACQSNVFRDKQRKKVLGKKWVNNTIIQKYVTEIEMVTLIDTGWILGMLKRKN